MGWKATGGGASPLTTKGDLHGYDTGDTRIPAGTNTHVLTADDTQAKGVKWAAPSGGGGDFTFIEEDDLAVDGTISFASIASSYRELLIVGRARGANAVNASTLTMRVGNSSVDTGSNYVFGMKFDRQGAGDGFSGSGSGTFFNIGLIPGGNTTVGYYVAVVIHIMNYTDTSDGRAVWAQCNGYDNLNNSMVSQMGGEWLNTASAIDIITLKSDSHSNDLEAGSRLALYGVG